jgi:hypothetical protein
MQRWLWTYVPPALALVGCLLTPFAFASPLPNAWQVNSTGSLVNYTNDLSTDLQIAATNTAGGFDYTINARLLSGSSSAETIAMAYGLGTNRFLIWFYLDDAGDLTADLDGLATYTLTTNGTGTALYHYHEILYNPATGQASYLFDGRAVMTNWVPAGNSLTNGQVFWGAGNSSGAGTMNFHTVAFKITNAIVAAYDAGSAPDTAQDPTNAAFAWGLSASDSTSVSGVSPDPVPLPTTPLPTTLDATNVSAHQATLVGLGDQGNLAATVWFEWGTDTNYGNTTSPQPLLSDTNNFNLSQTITGLIKDTAYHFRCVATNFQGIAYGQDVTFITPATITVTNSDDAGPGTLRQAIADSASGDTIIIANIGGAIALTNGELLITNDLTIAAADADIAIDAGGNSRVLEIAAGNNVTLDSLIITNGHVSDLGGGILVDHDANLILTNCTVAGNSADGLGGGVYVTNSSTITINNSSLSGNSTSAAGGGIANDGSVLVATGSSFSVNSAAAGGGILNQNNGIVTLNNSTLSGNIATNFGGGILNTNGSTATINNSTISDNACPSDQGGGIDNWGALTINNCTVAGNHPGGGFVNTSGIAVCNNSTFSGNDAIFDGGGFYTSLGTNTLNNCTISGNSAGRRGGGFQTDVNSYSVLANTIVAGNTAVTGGPDIFGPVSGVNNLTNGNPLLAPLGDYGGPTQTMPPLAGSPAINAGLDSVTNLFTTDQRGYPRLAGTHVDIGAVEVQPAIVLNANDDGPGSLRAAAAAVPGLIAFTNTLSGQTIHLTSGQITLSNSVGIDASTLAAGILIDAGGNSRVLEITADNAVTLDSLTITNGQAADFGGGILVDQDATLMLANCQVAGNSAGAGGGIFNSSNGTVAVDNSAFSANSAGGNGGGIENYQAALTINNSIFSGNSATNNNGGAIDNDTNSSLVVNNSSFSGNAANAGGGIWNNSTLALNNCTLSGNSAGTGGGIFQDSSSTSFLTNTIVAGNTATNASDILGPFFGANNLTGGNPLLAALGNYGGPTQTMPPLAGSAAIDAGLDSAAASFITDQRGYPRQSGAHVDIGAVEAQFAPANNRPVLRLARVQPGGAWGISFTNIPNTDFTVLTSTNLALPLNQWSILGPATQNPPGQYQFNDSTATNHAARFYQAVSP